MKFILKNYLFKLYFIFTNLLFVFKYGLRQDHVSVYLLIIIYTLFCGFVLFGNPFKFIKLNEDKLKILYKVICFSIMIVVFIVVSLTDGKMLNVDRWSAMDVGIKALLNGEYPYTATDHLNGRTSNFPGLFIIGLPFYFIGELGYFSLLGILIFILFARKKNNYGFLFLLICISPFYLWEVVCRSNIFLNSMLMVICIHFLLMIKNKKKLYVLMIFIMIGLVLSIRNVFVIPLGISLIYLTRTKKINIKVLTQFTFISLATFVLTFIPFIYDHLEDFLKVNPFIIQSDGLMPISWSLFFVATSCLTSYLCKNNLDVFFFIGLSLFITIVGHYIYHTIEDGYKEAFFNSKADISYFIFCVPFLAFTYSNSKINLSNLKHNQVVK